MTQKVKNVVLSKGKNIPCVWEEKKEDNKVAIVVCDKNGNQKRPIFMQKESQQQALIPVRTRDIIVKAELKGETILYTIYGIKSIDTDTLETELIVLNNTDGNGTFTKPLFEKFERVIEAVKYKISNSDTLAHYVRRDRKPEKAETK